MMRGTEMTKSSNVTKKAKYLIAVGCRRLKKNMIRSAPTRGTKITRDRMGKFKILVMHFSSVDYRCGPGEGSPRLATRASRGWQSRKSPGAWPEHNSG